MITIKQPTDWKDLQAMVAEILTQCEFHVEVEAVLKTVRGDVEIDVYATEEIRGRKYTIACECKRWNADIPQTVVHAFRTIIQDLGCNIGYIITTSDFQSGAILNADFTNIELLTWTEFQEKFIDTWFENYFVPIITKKLDPLMSYCEPLLPRWYSGMTNQDKESFYKLKEIYDGISFIVLTTFSTYSRTFNSDINKRASLPIIGRINLEHNLAQNIPKTILNEIGYAEFLQETVAFGEKGIASFRQLRDKYGALPR